MVFTIRSIIDKNTFNESAIEWYWWLVALRLRFINEWRIEWIFFVAVVTIKCMILIRCFDSGGIWRPMCTLFTRKLVSAHRRWHISNRYPCARFCREPLSASQLVSVYYILLQIYYDTCVSLSTRRSDEIQCALEYCVIAPV